MRGKEELIQFIKDMPIEFATKEPDKYATTTDKNIQFCTLGWVGNYLFPLQASNDIGTLGYGEKMLGLLETCLLYTSPSPRDRG